ncbi:MAG: hypothetical protein UZ15_CFX003001147 [Chloroflexi bacterium OLB15]|nr:MAG: hypothetical protein UZ15_CFX003001147 [Chloroflexi bacterium OLB15]
MTGTAVPIGSRQPSEIEKERLLLRNRKYIATVVMLIIAGILGLVIAEQFAAGWLALGERANISRRDLNVLEIVLLVTSAIWGLLCLYTAIGLIRHPSTPSYSDYLEHRVGKNVSRRFTHARLLDRICRVIVVIRRTNHNGLVTVG